MDQDQNERAMVFPAESTKGEQVTTRKNWKATAKLAVKPAAVPMDKRKIVRTYSAGVFFGEVESRNGREFVLRNARRIWQWCGAASLSQLATDGTSEPKQCKFPCAVDRVELLEVIEVLDVTAKAAASIDGVSVWAL